MVYAVGYGHAIVGITTDGTIRWQLKTGFKASPAVDRAGIVYAGASGQLVAISSSGEPLWEGAISPNRTAEPVIGQDGTIYLGAAGSWLTACAAGGSELWSTYLGAGMNGEAPTLLADGTLLVTLSNGNLWAVNAADGKLKWHYRTITNDPTAPNVGPDGTIYFATAHGEVHALAGTSPLADSPWPKYRHDAQNTGRAGWR
jgi:outer membrane protein assembly factor BamB